MKNLTAADDDTVLLYAQWRLRTPNITLNQNVSTHGDTITVTGADFEPDAEIVFTVHSAPKEVGRMHADAQGEVLFIFQMPSDVEAGDHTLLADNGIHSAQVPIKVTTSAHADSNAADSSANAGSSSAGTAANRGSVTRVVNRTFLKRFGRLFVFVCIFSPQIWSGLPLYSALPKPRISIKTGLSKSRPMV